MMEELNDLGAQIDAVFACPFHVNGKGPFIHPDHPNRKPNAGMLLQAAAKLQIDLTRSWIAGDRASDVGAGLAAGCAGGIHLRTGHGNSEEEASAAIGYGSAAYPVKEAASIAGLAEIIPILTIQDDITVPSDFFVSIFFEAPKRRFKKIRRN